MQSRYRLLSICVRNAHIDDIDEKTLLRGGLESILVGLRLSLPPSAPHQGKSFENVFKYL